MSDQELRAGLRALFSGGATQLGDDTLLRLTRTALVVLDQRGIGTLAALTRIRGSFPMPRPGTGHLAGPVKERTIAEIMENWDPEFRIR